MKYYENPYLFQTPIVLPAINIHCLQFEKELIQVPNQYQLP